MHSATAAFMCHLEVHAHLTIRHFSSTLQAIGLDKKLIEGTLRFSFCENTTKEELDQALKALQELLPMLRRYTRR